MENILKEFNRKIDKLIEEQTYPSGAYLLKDFRMGYGTDETVTDKNYEQAEALISEYIKNPVEYEKYGRIRPVTAFVTTSYHLGGGSWSINVLTSNGIKLSNLSDYEFECLKNKIEYITQL